MPRVYQLYLGINLAFIALRCTAFTIGCSLFYKSLSFVVHDDERQSLLGVEQADADNRDSNCNYSSTQPEGHDSEDDGLPPFYKALNTSKRRFDRQLELAGNWFEHAKSFMVRFPPSIGILKLMAPDPLSIRNSNRQQSLTTQGSCRHWLSIVKKRSQRTDS